MIQNMKTNTLNRLGLFGQPLPTNSTAPTRLGINRTIPVGGR